MSDVVRQYDILDAVLEVMLGERADRTFDSDDLRAIGIDDTPPNPDAYRLDVADY